MFPSCVPETFSFSRGCYFPAKLTGLAGLKEAADDVFVQITFGR